MAEEPIDDEMIELFRAESTQQLEALEQALLRLEERPGDQDAVAAARREAHNLKGAARILGLHPVERLAHGIEDVLQAVDGEREPPPAALDALLAALDALQRLVDAATRGGSLGEVPVENVLLDLERARAREPGREPGPTEEPPGDEEDAEAGAEEPQDPLERAREMRIDTIRVDPDRLDVLMRRASELSSTVQRLGTVSEELERSRATVGELSQTVREGLPADLDPQVSQTLRRATETLNDEIEAALDGLETDTRDLARLADALEAGIQESRLLPMSTTFNLFARAVRDLARDEDKRIDLELEGERVRVDKRILEELNGPLMHLVRNAVDHGIEGPEERRAAGKDPEGLVRLSAQRTPDAVRIEVEDDGRGIDPDEIRRVARERGLLPEVELANLGDGEVVDLVFGAGVTTRETVGEVSGRGIGLRTVAETVEQLQGSVSLETTPGEGTLVSIEVPVELSTAHVLLVRAGPHTYGLPIDAVHRVVRLDGDDVDASGEEPTIELDGERVPVADIHPTLGIPRGGAAEGPGPRPCVVLRWGGDKVGIVADEVVGDTEVVVQPLDGVFRQTDAVTGASLLANGRVCIVLDPGQTVEGVRRSGWVPRLDRPADEARRRVLLVEDNTATRRQLERTLERAGWETIGVEGGEQAVEELEAGEVDAVVTDILMPDLDGLELTRRIRSEDRWRDLPVILVSTRDTDKEAEEGRRAGADAFLSKDSFDAAELATTLEELT